MERMHILKRVIEIVADKAQVDAVEVAEDRPLQALKLASIDLLDVIVSLEDEFTVKFDPTTLKDLSCRSLADSILRMKGGLAVAQGA